MNICEECGAVGGYHQTYCSRHPSRKTAPKPLTFTLSITLGNEAMSDYWDISDALNGIQYPHVDAVPVTGDTQVIRDRNGNTVGSWSVQ